MSIENPRMKSAVIATSGGESEILNQPAEKLQTVLSEKQSKRLRAALKQNIQIFPDKSGMYTVISYSGETQNRYTVDLKYEESQTCTCEDFLYRCDVDLGESCKHIWRTRMLVRVGALPEPSVDPYDWILDELAEDVQVIQSLVSHDEISEGPASRIESIYTRVETAHRLGVDFVDICLSRASVFQNVLTELKS